MEGYELIRRIKKDMHANAEKHEDGDWYLREEWVDEIIDKALSEEPKPGWWIWINDGVYRCSVCRELACCESNYCPNCGTKLTGRIVI